MNTSYYIIYRPFQQTDITLFENIETVHRIGLSFAITD